MSCKTWSCVSRKSHKGIVLQHWLIIRKWLAIVFYYSSMLDMFVSMYSSSAWPQCPVGSRRTMKYAGLLPPKPSWSTSPPVYSCACLTHPILMLHVAQFRCKQLHKGGSISHPPWYTCFPPSLHGCLLHWFILVLASFIPPLVSCPAQHLVSFLGPILSAWAPLCTDATSTICIVQYH